MFADVLTQRCLAKAISALPASDFRSDHLGGAQSLFCDGSVHFLPEDISMTYYRRLSTIAEGESAQIP